LLDASNSSSRDFPFNNTATTIAPTKMPQTVIKIFGQSPPGPSNTSFNVPGRFDDWANNGELTPTQKQIAASQVQMPRILPVRMSFTLKMRHGLSRNTRITPAGYSATNESLALGVQAAHLIAPLMLAAINRTEPSAQ